MVAFSARVYNFQGYMECNSTVIERLMAEEEYLPGLICIVIATILMFRLMRYAKFYGPSYFFWMGIILIIAGVISLFHPLKYQRLNNLEPFMNPAM